MQPLLLLFLGQLLNRKHYQNIIKYAYKNAYKMIKCVTELDLLRLAEAGVCKKSSLYLFKIK